MSCLWQQLTFCRTTYSNALHDRDGKLVADGSDYCDCLEPDCPGCHFPCVKCSSAKCSVDCRKGRKWTPDYVELEGTDQSVSLEALQKRNQDNTTY